MVQFKLINIIFIYFNIIIRWRMVSMKELNVEVIGVDPPCPRCKATEENVKKAAKKLGEEGIRVNVVKLNVSAPETVSKYGVLMSPALAVNGTVKIMGKVPDTGVVERILRMEL